MAKKKKEAAPPPGSPLWMTTFSDLMNILVCFFVLLFSFSSVDVDKFEQLVASLSNSSGILEGRSSTILEGTLVESGVLQLDGQNSLYEHLNKALKEQEENKIESIEDYDKQKLDQMREQSEQIADDIEELANEAGIRGDIDIKVEAQYVQLTLGGRLLFDSGQAAIKRGSESFMSKLGDILKIYEGNMVKILGHTDNIPLIGDPKYDDNQDLSHARAKSVASFLRNTKGFDISKMEMAGRGEYNPIATNDTPEGREQNRRVEIQIFNELSSQ